MPTKKKQSEIMDVMAYDNSDVIIEELFYLLLPIYHYWFRNSNERK